MENDRAFQPHVPHPDARACYPSEDRESDAAALHVEWGCILAVFILLVGGLSQAATAPAGFEELITQQPGSLIQTQGMVRFKPAAGTEINAAVPQPLGFGESLRTLELSGAAMRLTDQTHLRLWEMTRLEIIRRPAVTNAPTVRIYQGEIRASSRARGSGIPVEGPLARGIPHGTEFLISVDAATGRTEFTMFDGEVEMSNGVETRSVTSGQKGIADRGQPIRVVPILEAKNIIQWWIYYPGVLDLEELQFTPAAQTNLAASLDAYRAGSLVQALEKFPGYPQPQEPATDTERAYLAGLLLSVGAVDKAQRQLAFADSNAPPIRALRIMIDAVTQDFGSKAAAKNDGSNPFKSSEVNTASEALALSYRYQAVHKLEDALAAARGSVERSTNFGFGWARMAELEFSFGNIAEARRAVRRALDLSHLNAHAYTVNGFLLAAENHIRAAMDEFNKAIDLDSALGDSWLGRGLCKIRLNPPFPFPPFRSSIPTSALEDLEAAAALEPNRSLLRSYAGKAFAEAGNEFLAEKELSFARNLDTNDPTPYLYSALLKQQENRINEAISDLEASQERNDNRSLFRSRALLDEDRAVRSSSLANLYQSVGMDEVALREAARAVSYDYGNYSAHLFLADSYNALRDPTRFNLRYETAWFNELLLANLLSPVGGTPLSQHISQQEYSRLFERNRIGLSTDSSYRSDGQYRELASQFGVVGNTAWSLDLDYQHNDGIRPNNELDRIEWYATIKQQITPQDSIFLLTKYQDYHSGDNFQYFDWKQTNVVRTNFTFNEFQHPIAIGGYHHEWAPGVHTLILGGRLENDQRFSDRQANQDVLFERANGQVGLYEKDPFDVDYRSALEIFTGEINQIFKTHFLSFVAGTRVQAGNFNTRSAHDNPSEALAPFFTNAFPLVIQSKDDFEWLSSYGYGTYQPFDVLSLTAGLAYERVSYPRNHRNPPISQGTTTKDQFSPKAAIVWTPLPEATFRGVYTRSLGGVSLDESFRLEPAQLAGFPQSFRTLISESLVGSVSAPEHETFGLAMDLKLATGTYLGIQAERLESTVDHDIGVFRLENSSGSLKASSTRETLDYCEHSLTLTLNQIISSNWAMGAYYRFTGSELDMSLPEVPTTAIGAPLARSSDRSDLHQAGPYVLFNHSSGFFARAEANMYWQVNRSTAGQPAIHVNAPDDQFIQVNFFVGYHFLRRRGELSLGLLNLTDQDYHLNPLTPYSELPRERVFLARLLFNF